MDELYAELLSEAGMQSMIAPMAAPADPPPAASSDATGADLADWASSSSNGTTVANAAPTLGRKPKVRPGPAPLLHELLHGPPTITATAADAGQDALSHASNTEGHPDQHGTPAEIFVGYTVNTDGDTGEVWIPGPGHHASSPAGAAADVEELQSHMQPGTAAQDDTMVEVMLAGSDSELNELPALQAQALVGSGSEADTEPQLTEDPSYSSSEPEASCSAGAPHRPPPAVTSRSGIYVRSQACQAVPPTRSVSVQAEGSAIDDAVRKRTMQRPLPAPKHRRAGQLSDISCPNSLRDCLWLWVVDFCPVMYSTAGVCQSSLSLQAEVMVCDDNHQLLTWQDNAAVLCPHEHALRHACPPKQQDAAESPGTLVIRPDRLDPTALVCCACPIHGTVLCAFLTAGSATCRQLSLILGEHLAQTVPSEVRVDCCHQLPRSWAQNASLCTVRVDPAWVTLLPLPYLRGGIMQSAFRHVHVFNVSSASLHTSFTYPCKSGSRLCRHRYRAPKASQAIASPRRKVTDLPRSILHQPPAQDMERLFSSSSDSTSNSDTDWAQANLERRLDVALEADRITMHCSKARAPSGEPAMLVAQLILHAWHRIARMARGPQHPCRAQMSLRTPRRHTCPARAIPPPLL